MATYGRLSRAFACSDRSRVQAFPNKLARPVSLEISPPLLDQLVMPERGFWRERKTEGIVSITQDFSEQKPVVAAVEVTGRNAALKEIPVALGVGAIVGTGILTLIGVGADRAGPAVLLSWKVRSPLLVIFAWSAVLLCSNCKVPVVAFAICAWPNDVVSWRKIAKSLVMFAVPAVAVSSKMSVPLLLMIAVPALAALSNETDLPP